MSFFCDIFWSLIDEIHRRDTILGAKSIFNQY